MRDSFVLVRRLLLLPSEDGWIIDQMGLISTKARLKVRSQRIWKKVIVAGFFALVLSSPQARAAAGDLACRDLFTESAAYTWTEHAPVIHPVFGHKVRPVTVTYPSGAKLNFFLNYLPREIYEQANHSIFEHILTQLGGQKVPGLGESPVERDPSVNCHGYSCIASGVPGIPNGAWVELNPTGTLHPIFTAETFLSEFFTRVRSVSPAAADTIATDTSLREGDMVGYRNALGYMHTGLIVRKTVNGVTRNWLRSKLGREMVVDVLPDKIRELYPFDSIEIWRKRK